MRKSLGETRSTIGMNHALISGDSHEVVSLPSWQDAELVHLVTPHLGAQFSLFIASGAAEFRTGSPITGAERFVLVREGQIHIEGNGFDAILKPDDYAFLPAGFDHRLWSDQGASLIVFERQYSPSEQFETMAPFHASIDATKANPLKGDERLLVQKLLPQGAMWDMEINVMDFQPGAGLPYVETHFMEHGLVMLDGGGIYRLDESWYPVEAGDAIWMGPHCPQWFAAVGRENARYLIYKNWNRDPLA